MTLIKLVQISILKINKYKKNKKLFLKNTTNTTILTINFSQIDC